MARITERRCRLNWKYGRRGAGAVLLAALAIAATDAAEPRPVLYGATEQVRAVAVTPNGAVWAATAGGVVCWRSAAETPRGWTTADGLPGDDVRTIRAGADGSVTAVSSAGAAAITADGAVTPCVAPPLTRGETIAAASAGRDTLMATAAGLSWHEDGGKPVPVPLPQTEASHVSALAAWGGAHRRFAVGLYGGGVYRLTLGTRGTADWARLSLPSPCDHPTALASAANNSLVIGTREGGVYVLTGDRAQKCALPPNAVPSADIYALATYRARLYAATFDSGVLCLSDNGVPSVNLPHTSLRALATANDRLYALTADHRVLAFDGETWQAAFPAGTLRRAEVYSIAAYRNGTALLIGGWGGWARWDGITCQQHWNTAALAGEGITAIADGGGAVWLGTQRRGLFRAEGDSVRAFQEAAGITDDWITALAVSSRNRLLVGTYSGGLFEQIADGTCGRFVPRFRAANWAIRAIAFRGETALAATPAGLFREAQTTATGYWTRCDSRTTGGSEAQAVLPAAGGAWVGTRTGLAFMRW